MSRSLEGLRVVEIASAAPAPFACMMLADAGAEVVRIDRPGRPGGRRLNDPLVRGRRSLAADLKSPDGVAVVRRLVQQADVVVEGFRPGVMERLGLGPEVLLEANPGLVYARMTGFGQTGPLAARAGHDINYIAVAGALEPMGRAGERPHAPLNLVGDFGGGGMLLAFGILAAVHERTRSGRGQVVDAAMVDGAALLTAFVHGVRADGHWRDERGTNLLDGGAPFYDTYVTSDGGYMAVGALERRFYRQLLVGLALDQDPELPEQMDRSRWDELRHRIAEVFRTETREHWTKIFSDVDACVSPVLAPAEVAQAPTSLARDAFIELAGVQQPAPAPRFSRTPSSAVVPPRLQGEDTEDVLRDWGFTDTEIGILLQDGAVSAPAPAIDERVSAG